MVAIWASWSLWMLLRPYICSPLGVEVLSGEAASCLMFPLEAQSWTILEEARQPGSRATRQRTQLAPPLHNVATRSGGFQSLCLRPCSHRRLVRVVVRVSVRAPVRVSLRPRRHPRLSLSACRCVVVRVSVRLSLCRRPRLSPRVAAPSSAYFSLRVVASSSASLSPRVAASSSSASLRPHVAAPQPTK